MEERQGLGWFAAFEHVSFDLNACPLLSEFYPPLARAAESVETAGVGLGKSEGWFRDGLSDYPLPISRQERDRKILRYLEKKRKRVYVKRISYDCRKRVADNRQRVKGRFISKKEEQDIPPANT